MSTGGLLKTNWSRNRADNENTNRAKGNHKIVSAAPELKWHKDYSDGFPDWAAPVLDDQGRMYYIGMFGTNWYAPGHMWCIDTATGEPVWKYDMSLMGDSGTTYSYPSADGVYKYKYWESQYLTPIVGHDGTVYTIGNAVTGLSAVNPDGTMKWHQGIYHDITGNARNYISTPVYANGQIWFENRETESYVGVLDTGEWIPATHYVPDGNYYKNRGIKPSEMPPEIANGSPSKPWFDPTYWSLAYDEEYNKIIVGDNWDYVNQVNSDGTTTRLGEMQYVSSYDPAADVFKTDIYTEFIDTNDTTKDVGSSWQPPMINGDKIALVYNNTKIMLLDRATHAFIKLVDLEPYFSGIANYSPFSGYVQCSGIGPNGEVISLVQYSTKTVTTTDTGSTRTTYHYYYDLISLDKDLNYLWHINAYNNSSRYNSSNMIAIAADGTILYAQRLELMAFDLNGTHKWTKSLEAYRTYSYEMLCAPSVDTDGTIYIGTDEGQMFALASGESAFMQPPVTNLSATPAPNDITLSWVNPTNIEFSHVKILRDGVLVLDNVTDITYHDTGLESFTEYHYTVIAVAQDGTESEPAYVSATTTDPIDETPLPPPPGGSVGEELKNRVRIRFDRNKDSRTEFYYIYRSDEKGVNRRDPRIMKVKHPKLPTPLDVMGDTAIRVQPNTYQLMHTGVFKTKPVTVYIDGIVIGEEEYSLDYGQGFIVFRQEVLETSVVTADYSFDGIEVIDDWVEQEMVLEYYGPHAQDTTPPTPPTNLSILPDNINGDVRIQYLPGTTIGHHYYYRVEARGTRWNWSELSPEYNAFLRAYISEYYIESSTDNGATWQHRANVKALWWLDEKVDKRPPEPVYNATATLVPITNTGTARVDFTWSAPPVNRKHSLTPLYRVRSRTDAGVNSGATLPVGPELIRAQIDKIVIRRKVSDGISFPSYSGGDAVTVAELTDLSVGTFSDTVVDDLKYSYSIYVVDKAENVSPAVTFEIAVGNTSAPMQVVGVQTKPFNFIV